MTRIHSGPVPEGNCCSMGELAGMKEWLHRDENKSFRDMIAYKYKDNKKEAVKSTFIKYRFANPFDPIFNNDSFALYLRKRA